MPDPSVQGRSSKQSDSPRRIRTASIPDRYQDSDVRSVRDNYLSMSKNLLIVAPHFGAFIKDQAISIRSYFKSVTALIPIPRFSRMIIRLPYANRYFRSIRFAIESCESLNEFSIVPLEFSTLPIETMRRRNCYLAAKSCVKILSRNVIDFDLVHAHFLENGFVGVVCKNLRGTPLIVTAHGGDVYNLPFRDNWYNNLARYVLSEADKVITVSHFLAEKLSALGVSSKKLHVIPNGYDENLFKPLPSNAMRKKLGLPLNKRILLSVGNLVDVKGHTYLVDAMRFVLKKQTGVLLVIVGAGALHEKLQKRINVLGLNGKILLVGRKPHNEIPMWMNASDLFVLPSLGEGFPTVVPEAMACGKPVIGTCVGGVQEAVANESVGILVNPKDPEMLAHAILEALDRKWVPQTIVGHARQYSWHNLVEQILSVYQEVLFCA